MKLDVIEHEDQLVNVIKEFNLEEFEPGEYIFHQVRGAKVFQLAREKKEISSTSFLKGL